MASKATKQRIRQANPAYQEAISAFRPQGGASDGAVLMQSMRVNMYAKLIKSLAVSRFTWTGLPNGIDSRYIELMLLDNGLVLFFPDTRPKVRRFMVTAAAYQGNVNPYFNATEFTPVANNYSYKTLNSKECVPIWDNMLREPFNDIIALYAERLAMIDRALDVNLDNMSIPLIVTVQDENQRLTLENMIKQKQDGVPAILVYGDGLGEQFQSFPNVTPYLSDKLLSDKAQVWNECMSFLGIQNSNTEKKERLLTGEIAAGSERTNIFRLSFLKARQQACDTIKLLWPALSDIGVDWADPSSGGIMSTDDNKYLTPYSAQDNTDTDTGSM